MAEKLRVAGIIGVFLLMGAILWWGISETAPDGAASIPPTVPKLTQETDAIPVFEFDELDSRSEIEKAVPESKESSSVNEGIDDDAAETDLTVYASISGQIINKLTQQPITNFSVFVYYGLYDYNMDKRFARQQDEHGQFSVGHIEADEAFSLRVRAEGYVDIGVPLAAINGGSEFYGIVVPMDSLNTVTGTVVDVDGHPIAGADIRHPKGAGSKPGTLVECDEDGIFVLEGIIAGQQHLSAHNEGFLSETVALDVQQGENEIEFVLTRPTSQETKYVVNDSAIVEGVVSFNGVAMANSMVHLTLALNPEEYHSDLTVTAENGYYRFLNVPEGSGSLTLRLESEVSQRALLSEVKTKIGMVSEVNLWLGGTSSVEGYIMSGETESQLGHVTLNVSTESCVEFMSMDTDSNGYYRFTMLPAGRFVLMTGDSALARGELATGEAVRLDLPLYGDDN